MFVSGGIAIDAWVRIQRGCPIEWHVVADEAQFDIGSSATTLTLVASEEGLAALVTTASDALRAMRARPPAGAKQGTFPPDPVSS